MTIVWLYIRLSLAISHHSHNNPENKSVSCSKQLFIMRSSPWVISFTTEAGETKPESMREKILYFPHFQSHDRTRWSRSQFTFTNFTTPWSYWNFTSSSTTSWSKWTFTSLTTPRSYLTCHAVVIRDFYQLYLTRGPIEFLPALRVDSTQFSVWILPSFQCGFYPVFSVDSTQLSVWILHNFQCGFYPPFSVDSTQLSVWILPSCQCGFYTTFSVDST